MGEGSGNKMGTGYTEDWEMAEQKLFVLFESKFVYIYMSIGIFKWNNMSLSSQVFSTVFSSENTGMQ